MLMYIIMFDRRLQNPARRRPLSAGRGRRASAEDTVAAIIREAIDETLPVELEPKRRAAAELLAAEAVPVPETVEELKTELRAGRGW